MKSKVNDIKVDRIEMKVYKIGILVTHWKRLMLAGHVSTKKRAQHKSCELNFIWNKMRTAAWETAPQIAPRSCSKAAVRGGEYIRFW